MFYKADRYTKRIHPNKSKRLATPYTTGAASIWIGMTTGCLATNKRGATCSNSDGSLLNGMCWSKGRASPDDPHLKDYWMKRQAAKARDLTFSKQKLAKRQKGRCPECGESLFNDEELQVHHLLRNPKGERISTAILFWFICSAISTFML